MNSTAFSILGLDIKWYGIFIASGAILGMLVAKYTSKLRNANYDEIINTLIISLPIGIIGARLYYVIFEFNYYKDNLWQIFNIRQGGLAIHGGLIFGLLSAIIYTRYKKLNFLQMADAAVPSIILAQSIGRWGNFFNQEAHGGEVSEAFISKFPKFIQNGMYIDGTYYHPTFLYESIWNLSCFIVLLFIAKKTRRNGITFFSYITFYSLGRFFIEGLRTDSLMLGPIRVAQLVSLTGFTFGLLILLGYFIKNKTTHEIN